MLGAIAAVAAWRATRRRMVGETGRRQRPSVVARALEAVGLAPPATIGVGMALEPGRGRTAVPVRSSLVGAAVAVLGVAAVAVFAASLDHLVATPRAYGINWDGVVDDTRMELAAPTDSSAARSTTRLDGLPRRVEAVASVCSLSITLDGRARRRARVPSLRGTIEPTVLEGGRRWPTDEVALGSRDVERARRARSAIGSPARARRATSSTGSSVAS